MKEKDLFPPLKAHFKGQGYKVYAEVPCFYRGVDFVAVNGEDHIAVEMKMMFNTKVCQQAHDNSVSFGKSYIAFPVKNLINYENNDVYWKLRESTRNLIEYCRNRGIGIIQIVGQRQIIVTVSEAVYKKPYRIFDFSQYRESVKDEAGLPYQKGVSQGYMELKAIKAYLKKHPYAKWKEIWGAVQNHYSSPASLGSSMRSWRGFNLEEFRMTILPTQIKPNQKSFSELTQHHEKS